MSKDLNNHPDGYLPKHHKSNEVVIIKRDYFISVKIYCQKHF